jgi:hypothetical protein
MYVIAFSYYNIRILARGIMKKPVAVPLEIEEQKMYIKWLDMHNIMYFAVPNAVPLAKTLKTTGQKIRFWKKRRAEGIRPGVPDLVVFLPNQILFVEMKRQKRSYPSAEQKKWIENINLFGYAYAQVTKGGQQAIELTNRLLLEAQ